MVGRSVVGSGGVIASAQIEYISYVFITTAAGPLPSRYLLHLQLHLSPGVASTTPGYTGVAPREGESGTVRKNGTQRERGDAKEQHAERRKKSKRRAKERGGIWGGKERDVDAAGYQKPKEKRATGGVNERERRGELGWFRRGHGKSTVRRYRLTDVRLSVVKR